MFIFSINSFLIAAATLMFASAPASAASEYDIRCNPGGGQLPRDGVLCFAFRPGTQASDFNPYPGLSHTPTFYFADDGRGMAVDCPAKDPRTDGDDRVIVRKTLRDQAETYLILKGQAQSGKHKCCFAEWARGDGKLYKWCPDMAPLQV